MPSLRLSRPRGTDLTDDAHGEDWLSVNRALWDERVPLHLASEFYDQSALRAGHGELYPIEEAELAALFPAGIAGKRVLHLQCHFGLDSLALAQRGAAVVGVDFSKPAVLAARGLASELGLDARFIIADVYDLRHTLPEPESFDIVYTTWGTIGWLPDVAEWARLVAWYLKPGGVFYFADGHPAAHVFEGDGALPAFAYPYADAEPIVTDEQGSYAEPGATLEHTRTFEWMHPLGDVLNSLLDAGLRVDFVHEHFEVPYRMFGALVPTERGMYGWPERKWLPLSVSIAASH